MSIQTAILPGSRLHLQHGPIDLIIGAVGEHDEVMIAYDQAREAFSPVLVELAGQLSVLRAEARADLAVRGDIAAAMLRAVLPHAVRSFITPMAAVAGAVADHILTAMTQGRRLSRAYVNNGGDIAIHLAPGEIYRIGIVGSLETASVHGTAEIRAEQPIRGIATSGAAGRSFSLGIADSVTVLARDAAAADAAATMIANAVDLPGHAHIRRRPAQELSPDSDLGMRPVTVTIGSLTQDECRQAVASGVALARDLHQEGLIEAATLCLRGVVETVGGVTELTADDTTPERK